MDQADHRCLRRCACADCGNRLVSAHAHAGGAARAAWVGCRADAVVGRWGVRSGQEGGGLPWALLIIASVAANVAVAEPTLIGRVIVAWPSFALTVSYELLTRQVRRAAIRKDQEDDGKPYVRPAAKASPAPAARQPLGPPARALRGAARSDDLQRQAWQWALVRQASDGRLPSGKAIAGEFGRQERWGRLVKNAGLASAFGKARVPVEP